MAALAHRWQPDEVEERTGRFVRISWGRARVWYERSRMASADDWLVARQRIVEAEEPMRSPHFGALYALAIADADIVLRTYWQIDAARRADLVHELLSTRLDAILGADNPRGLYVTALVRMANSWLRRKDAEVREMPHPDAVALHENPTRKLELAETLARLSERERSVVMAVGMGEDRDEIARVHGTSRQNVDQIVSRVRRKIQEDE